MIAEASGTRAVVMELSTSTCRLEEQEMEEMVLDTVGQEMGQQKVVSF
jgi:hypothetical protein